MEITIGLENSSAGDHKLKDQALRSLIRETDDIARDVSKRSLLVVSYCFLWRSKSEAFVQQ